MGALSAGMGHQTQVIRLSIFKGQENKYLG